MTEPDDDLIFLCPDSMLEAGLTAMHDAAESSERTRKMLDQFMGSEDVCTRDFLCGALLGVIDLAVETGNFKALKDYWREMTTPDALSQLREDPNESWVRN